MFGVIFVQMLVCVVGFFMCYCGVCYIFSNVQIVVQFNGVEQVGVEYVGSVGDVYVFEVFLQFCQFVDGFLYQFWCMVDIVIFFYCQVYFVVDFCLVFVVILVNQIFQMLFNVSCLCFNCCFVVIIGSCCMFCCLFIGQMVEDYQFCQGVGVQMVCIVQINRGIFIYGEQIFNVGFIVLIGFDIVYGVVCGWMYWNWFFNWIDVNVCFCQFVDEWQMFMQFFFVEVMQVEINYIIMWCGDGVVFMLFVLEGLRNFVVWIQFYIFVFWFVQWSFWVYVVILQIMVVIFVDQNIVFIMVVFGYQDIGIWQIGWVILNEFYVMQWNVVVQCYIYIVIGNDVVVGVVMINVICIVGSYNDCVSMDLYQCVFYYVYCYQVVNMIIINQNIQYEMFVKMLDLWELQRGLEQCVQYMEVGFIGGELGMFDFYVVEVMYVDVIIWVMVLWVFLQFQLGYFGWVVVDEIIYDILFI